MDNMFGENYKVRIGDIFVGVDFPILIQSMTNTNTSDTEATVNQCRQLFESGAGLVRITARNVKEAKNLLYIRQLLKEKNYCQPLCADIHFNPAIAMEALKHVEKIRINPGNFVDLFPGKISYTQEEFELEKNEIRRILMPLLEECKKYCCAVRIGINKGSLSRRMIDRFGNTANALAESALEFAMLFHELDFHDTVISIKASSVMETVEANILLNEKLNQNQLHFPIHLGITEAGEGEDGVLKSAVGIGTLLLLGIGDTIRVSLTGDPIQEIKPAQEIISASKKINHFISKRIVINENLPRDFGSVAISSSFPSLNESSAIVKLKLFEDLENYFHSLQNENSLITVDFSTHEFTPIEASLILGYGLVMGRINRIWLEKEKDNIDLVKTIVQSCGRGRFKTEFISCPSCGRTNFDIQKVVNEVKTKFSEAPNLSIAVMGCIVNGPGEMKGADAGIVGSGVNKVTLFWKGMPIMKNVAIEEALMALEQKINEKIEK